MGGVHYHLTLFASQDFRMLTEAEIWGRISMTVPWLLGSVFGRRVCWCACHPVCAFQYIDRLLMSTKLCESFRTSGVSEFPSASNKDTLPSSCFVFTPHPILPFVSTFPATGVGHFHNSIKNLQVYFTSRTLFKIQ